MNAAAYQSPNGNSDRRYTATHIIDIDTETQPKAIWGSALAESQAPLTIHLSDLKTQFMVNLNERLILGRKSPDTETLVNLDFSAYNAVENGVSRVHATLYRVNRVIHIMDMNSSNGTFLNGRRLAPYQERILRDGDAVSLGRLHFTVHF